MTWTADRKMTVRNGSVTRPLIEKAIEPKKNTTGIMPRCAETKRIGLVGLDAPFAPARYHHN